MAARKTVAVPMLLDWIPAAATHNLESATSPSAVRNFQISKQSEKKQENREKQKKVFLTTLLRGKRHSKAISYIFAFRPEFDWLGYLRGEHLAPADCSPVPTFELSELYSSL